MIFLGLFFLWYSLFMHGSYKDYHAYQNRMEMRDQLMGNCPVDCANPACKKIQSTNPNLYFTFHQIEEIDARKYQLNADFRYFINYNGSVLISLKDAKTKNELVLFQGKNSYEYHPEKVEYTLREIFDARSKENIEKLQLPVFDIIRPSHNAPNSPKYDASEVFKELLCCAKVLPTEVIDIINKKVLAIVPNYLYYFFDTKGKSEKKFLFGILNLTKMTNCFQDSKNRDIKTIQKDVYEYSSWGEYRFFLVDHQFAIKKLHAEVDFYSNNSKRLVMLGEYQETIKKYFFFSETKKHTILMHVPTGLQYMDCFYCQENGSYVAMYTMQDMEDHHVKMAKDQWNQISPFCCYHAHYITGNSKELERYVNTALLRIFLRTNCVYKNDAASTDMFTVCTNPFGELVFQNRDKTYTVMEGLWLDNSLWSNSIRRHDNLYRPVYDNDIVRDGEKMKMLAQKYAEQWKKTDDGKALYYWEEYKEGAVCSSVWPFGKQHGWERYSNVLQRKGYKDFYFPKSREQEFYPYDTIQSFSRYRLWVLELAQSQLFTRRNNHPENVFERYFDSPNPFLYFTLAYTDLPYDITDVQYNRLTLNNDKSDFIVYLFHNSYVIGKNPVIFCSQQSFNENYNTYSSSTLVYVYKDENKLKEFQNKKNEFKAAKIRENEKIESQGLSDSVTSKDKTSDIEKKTAYVPKDIRSLFQYTFSSLRKPMTIIVGSIVLGAVLRALSELWHKQVAVDTKLSAPTV